MAEFSFSTKFEPGHSGEAVPRRSLRLVASRRRRSDTGSADRFRLSVCPRRQGFPARGGERAARVRGRFCALVSFGFRCVRVGVGARFVVLGLRGARACGRFHLR
eukprot:6519497-Alexandrium_andersonii.AAC.1